jgi:hypothetical protein
MVVSVETAWLFTRASDSVRIIRAVARDGVVHLLVQGPGTAADARQFTDVLACMNYQADLERRLVAGGFSLARFTSDRRSGRGGQTPAGAPERRREPVSGPEFR